MNALNMWFLVYLILHVKVTMDKESRANVNNPDNGGDSGQW